jgi:hypothetical protein
MKRFRADLELAEKIREWAPVFLYMLFKRYNEYKVRGVKEPIEVQASTNVYRALNDIYLQYFQERIEKVEVADGSDPPFLPVRDLYADFMQWHRSNYSSYRDKFNATTVGHELSKKLGPQIKNGNLTGWNGYQLIDEMEDYTHNAVEMLAKAAKNP